MPYKVCYIGLKMILSGIKFVCTCVEFLNVMCFNSLDTLVRLSNLKLEDVLTPGLSVERFIVAVHWDPLFALLFLFSASYVVYSTILYSIILKMGGFKFFNSLMGFISNLRHKNIFKNIFKNK